MIDKEQLSTLIPHAGDMCLMDAVEEWTADRIRCVTRTHLTPHHPLRRQGQLAAVHLVEYAAQAMAIHGALRSRYDRSVRLEMGLGSIGSKLGLDSPQSSAEPPQPGMLGVLRDIKLHVERIDTLAGPLTVTANRRLGRADGLVYDFAVEHDTQLVCEGRVVIAFVDALAKA
jgi:predicted hotdog family 3-hydroxylacyl-ACP dehydratase